MSNNDKPFDYFVKDQINAINDYYDWEIFRENYINKKISKKNQQFTLIEKKWLDKWKECLSYEKIKDKCKAYHKKASDSLFKEIKDHFLILNSQQKLKDLGNMNTSNLKIKNDNYKNKNEYKFKEESDLYPFIKYFAIISKLITYKLVEILLKENVF